MEVEARQSQGSGNPGERALCHNYRQMTDLLAPRKPTGQRLQPARRRR